MRDRASYAFALVSVAAVLRVDDGTVGEVRVALGGVGTKPWRAHECERLLAGGPADEDAYRRAAEAELAAANLRQGNEFNQRLAVATITAVLRDLTTPEA